MNYLAVGIGGILGAILRYSITISVMDDGSILPLGTLTANLTGCLLLGYFYSHPKFNKISNFMKAGFGSGFIGAYTTFSAFSMEVVFYLEEEMSSVGLLYVIGSAVLGYLFIYVGYLIAQMEKRSAAN